MAAERRYCDAVDEYVRVAEGLADRYWDAKLAGAAGWGVFEWNDEWHKQGEPSVQHDGDTEEYFGLLGFGAVSAPARAKPVTWRTWRTSPRPSR